MLFRRPLIPCIAAYAVGLWLVHSVFHVWAAFAVYLFAALCVGGIALTTHRKDWTPVYLLLIMVAGAMVMGVRERDRYVARDLVKSLDGPLPHLISGRIRAVSDFDDGDRSRVVMSDVEITSGSRRFAMPGKARFSADNTRFAATARNLVAGEIISFPGHVYEPGSLGNFFGYDRLEVMRHKGVYSSVVPMDLEGIVRVDRGSGGTRGAISHALVKLRRRLTHNLQRDMWKREGRLMVAMLFNDMRGLADADRDVFRKSQTLHLFAVSGLHVGILAVTLMLLFRTLRFGIRGSWIMVVVLMFFYLWLIDFVPSATRAYLMLLAFAAGHIFRREVDHITALALAVAVIIALEPAALWKAGFILSVTGVTAIILLAPLFRLWFFGAVGPKPDHWSTFYKDKAANIVVAAAAVTIFIFPLQIYYFGFWNIMSPVANLLQAVLAQFVLSTGLLCAIVGMISQRAGEIVGQSASALMHVVYLISKNVAETQWAVVSFPQLPTSLLLAFYALLLSGYYLVRRDAPEFRFKSRARFAAHCCCAMGCLFAWQLWSAQTRQPLEIWSLDVGQGDATLFRFPNGETMLIDGGKPDPDMGSLIVVPQLRGLGIDRLDYVVASHDDDDHTGGLAAVIQTVNCMNVLTPESMDPKSRPTIKMLKAAKSHFCMVKKVETGYQAHAGGCLIEILNPSTASNADIPDNDQSIVVRVSYGKFVGLFMADAGLAVEGRLINEQALSGATVLKIGHHGSKSATGAGFLKQVRPQIALVSCGARNHFGHPAKEVVRRLLHYGVKILRTDQRGAIKIETDGQTMKVRTVK